MANPYNQFFRAMRKVYGANTSGTTQGKIKATQKQIDNLDTRLSAAGVENAGDTRNFVEKALNLTPNQNFLFDIFELLNRPQQALFGGINEAQQGGDFLKGLKEGISGDRDTRFKNILMDTDLGLEDSKGKLDLVDVLGFAGDVFLDPMIMKLIPTKGASGLAMKSGSNLVFEGAGKAIKGTAKAADSEIMNTLQHLDEVKGVANSADEIAKITYKNPLAKSAGQLGKTIENASELSKGVPHGRLENYVGVKDWFNRSFNNAKAIPSKVMYTVRGVEASKIKASQELAFLKKTIDESINKAATEIATAAGDTSVKNIQKIAKQLDKDLLNVKEFAGGAARVGSGRDMLAMAQDGVLKATDESLSFLTNLAEDINKAERGLNLAVEVTDIGTVKLSKDWSKVGKKAYEGLDFNPDLLNMELTLPTNYRPEQLEELTALTEKFKNDPVYKELYDRVDNVFNDANKILDENFGTNLSGAYQDNAGWVRHGYNKESVEKATQLGVYPEGGPFKLKGDTKVLDERKYKMSVMEANNLFDDTIKKNYDKLTPDKKAFVDAHEGLFKSNLTASFEDFVMNVPEVAMDNKMINEVLVEQTFGNYKEIKGTEKAIKAAEKAGDKKLIKKLNKKYAEQLDGINMKILTAKDQTIPSGFKLLNSDESKALSQKLKKLGGELGMDSFNDLAKTVSTNRGKLAINEDILRLIGVNTKTEAGAMLRMYDKYLNFFKRNKVLSPTFQMNNVLGNTSNLALGGITPTQQAKYFPKANKIMRNAEDLMSKSAAGIKLTGNEQKMLDTWMSFIKEGFGDPSMSLNLRDMPDSLKKYFMGGTKPENFKEIIKDGLPYLNNYLNNQMDTMSRLVGFMAVTDNPNLLKSLNVKTAGDAVRKMLFDPSDLTKFETDVMKRIIPFYTFTKKNLVYHMQNIGPNAQRYTRLVNGIKSLGDSATDGNYDNIQDFLKDNLYIPIPGLGKNGEYKMIRAQIAAGDLFDMASSPFNNVVSMLSPAIRAPIEFATNKQAFSGADIESFPGEQSKSIPTLTKRQEYLLSQLTGLDVPAKQIFRGIEGAKEGGIGGALSELTTYSQDIDTDRLYKMYEELEQLENTVKQYRQRGYKFSTMNELKKANRNGNIESLMSKLNKLNGIKRNPYK